MSGYIFSPTLEIFLRLTIAQMKRGQGACLLLEGPPGGGKTSFAEDGLAPRLGDARCFYYSGAPDKERDLLCEIDVDGVLQRKNAWTPGPAWLAFEESRAGKHAVLLIDEVDKTNPGFDAFLLRLLEQFCFKGPGNREIRGDPSKLAVVLTSNGRRQLRTEVQRRCQRIHVPFPEGELLRRIVRQIAGQPIPDGLLTLLERIGNAIRKEDVELAPSPKEMALCALDLLELAKSGEHNLEIWAAVGASRLTKDPGRTAHLGKILKFQWAKALRNEATPKRLVAPMRLVVNDRN